MSFKKLSGSMKSPSDLRVAFFVCKRKEEIMSLKDTCASVWEAFPVAIESGDSLTGTINLGGLRLFGIVMPSEWTTANLTFQMSPDAGATWVDVVDQNGDEVLMAGKLVSYVAVEKPAQFAPLQYLRIRSGTSLTPISQSAARVLQLVLRSV
ncbi:MAG: hypothetical protein PHW63_05700 [Alphaproteobacteria bacterium]|nr:hypothetical protein [Alphaproteobacteria bacterium]